MGGVMSRNFIAIETDEHKYLFRYGFGDESQVIQAVIKLRIAGKITFDDLTDVFKRVMSLLNCESQL